MGGQMSDFLVPKRSMSPIGHAQDDPEVLNKFYRVSKIEENQALNFIRGRFLDYGIGLFKIQYGHTLSQRGEHKDLSVGVVSKRLKKVSEERFPGKRKHDVIRYSAPLIKSYVLDINIFKNEEGELAIGYNNPVAKTVKYFLVNGPQHLTPMFEADAPKPKAGFNDKGFPLWSDEEKYEHFHKISKQETDEALAYIKRTIVPMFVEKYNKWVVEGDRVSADTVNSQLKKIKQEKYPISLHTNVNHDLIVWQSDVKVSNGGIAKFIFFAFKYFAAQLFIGVRSPISAGIEVFAAHTSPPRKLDMDLRLDHNPQFFKESIEHDWHITKPEEQKALQFIRNSILDMVMEEYNESAAERKVPLIHHGPEQESIVQSLRKVRHTEFPEQETDQVLYIAEFKGWQWVFIIEKSTLGSGNKQAFLRAGYIDDIWNQSKMYDINIPRPDDRVRQWQAPKSSLKRVTDYMPFQKGGVPSLLKMKKDKLKEGYGKHDLRMNKREEDFAFHLLKQGIYDERAKKTIRKIMHVHSQSPLHVPDKIVYEVIYSDNTVAWFALGKNSRTGKLVYYPTDKDGERTTHYDSPLENDEDDQGLIESREKLNLHISKEEEAWALQQLRKRKNNQGESIGKYLRKIEHIVSSEPDRLSDRIKYKNTEDATTYTIVKNRLDGKLGYHAGYIAFKIDKRGMREPDNWESSNIDNFEIPLHEYVTPPWPDKTILTKMDEARGVQFIKYLTDRHMDRFVRGINMEKSIKKKSITPSQHPTVTSDAAVYEVTWTDSKSAKFTHTFEIFYSNRLGLMVTDPTQFARYYLDNEKPEAGDITEDVEKRMILTKKDEARAVQFIKGIKDPDNGYPLYNKSIKKKFNQPTVSPEMTSDSAYYEAYLPNLCAKQFRIFIHHKFGLIVRDNTDAVMYWLDQPSPYTALSLLRENKEQDIDPIYRITKKQEAEAVAWLGNITEKGERFGKNLRKIYDRILDGRHVIKYVATAGGSVGLFEIYKNQDGWLIIRTNSGSTLKVFKKPVT